ncbi:MAG: YchJ family protein [Chromatiaceae bacterium]|nr:YchJ family protein [Chromatiaceae bacterium]MCF8004124.1 YchJ family protein [Chromatiaceae bacterium]
MSTPCPCGSGHTLADCCGPFLAGTSAPATAEALMRSRYTAFNQGAVDYLRTTWHSSARPAEIAAEPAPTWMGLKILTTKAGGPEATEGWVEFVARYKIGRRSFRLHERSRFVREDGAWRYVDGVVDPD